MGLEAPQESEGSRAGRKRVSEVEAAGQQGLPSDQGLLALSSGCFSFQPAAPSSAGTDAPHPQGRGGQGSAAGSVLCPAAELAALPPAYSAS